MRRNKATYLLLGVVGLAAVAVLLAVSPDQRSPEPLLLYTEIQAGDGTVDWQYPERSRIVAVDPTRPEEAKVLTAGFISARGPSVSFDGRRMLFAGRKTAADSWGIWELSLDGGDARLLTPDMEGCTDPVYLPENQITFSALAPVDVDDPRAAQSLALFTAGSDGCCLERISFHPDAEVGATVLRDSRVLFASTSEDASQYLAMRYDGTGVDLYYESSRGGHVMRRPHQTEEGDLVFVETDSRSADGGRLVAVRDARPLHSFRDLSPEGVHFHSAFPSSAGPWIVSKRQSSDGTFSLFAFDPESGAVGERIAQRDGYHVVEPVMAVEHFEPDSFVSITDASQPGEMYSLDVDLSAVPAHREAGRSALLRVSDTNGRIGEAPVHDDGSVRIRVPPDTPLRFETLDADGNVVRGPSDWVWVRPNERRGCVGCHEDPELVPGNDLKKAFDEPAVSLLPGNAAVAVESGEH